MTGAITGIPEVDNMTPSQAFHAGLRSGKEERERLRATLMKVRHSVEFYGINGRECDEDMGREVVALIDAALSHA